MDLLSVVVRTSEGRQDMLDHALFSLAGQEYRPLEVIVVMHGAPEEAAAADRLVRRVGGWFDRAQMAMHQTEGDGRTRSLNAGMELATGRFLAFLDDDDAVYPAHYAELIGAMDRSGASWAYSDVARAEYVRTREGTLRPSGRSLPFRRDGYSFLDHLRGNFIPIHSFVVDLEATGRDLRFDERLTRHEDYEFLIRLARDHAPAYVPHVTCEYRIRADGSNTVMDGTPHGRGRREKQRQWNAADALLAETKAEAVGWWWEEALGVVATGGHVVAEGLAPAMRAAQRIVDEHWDSTSWRATSTLRRTAQVLRRQPRERRPIVTTVTDAERIAAAIRASTSWRLAAPLRWGGRILGAR